MSQEWARLPERGNLLAIRLICWIAQHIGRSVGRALLYPITLYFLIAAADARRGSQFYLRRVLGRKPSGRELFRHFHYFAATLLDRIYFLTGRLEYFKFAMVGGSLIKEQVASGQGCILLGAHLGSFEALRAVGGALPRLPLKILMKVEHNQTITQLLDALNPTMARAILPIGRPETLLEVQDSVAQGFLIGALGDRVAQDEKTVRCRFLGQETPFPIGPVLLAALMNCPIILFFGLYRGGNRYDIHFELFAKEIVLSPRRRQEQLTVWMQRYAERLEYYTRLAPYNWFNFYNYWDEEVS